MATKDVTRKELLERWSVIEQEDDADDDGFSSTQPIKRRRLRQLKEQWCKFTFSACHRVYLPINLEDGCWLKRKIKDYWFQSCLISLFEAGVRRLYYYLNF